jgi:hypothetical protein
MSVSTGALKGSISMLGAMASANLENVSTELAEVRPSPEANNARWVVGHIAYWRAKMLEMMGGADAGDEREWLERDFDTLRAEYQEAQDRLLEALDGQPSAEILDDLLSLSLHEAYHVGQLGLLRRAMGLEGAIAGP